MSGEFTVHVDDGSLPGVDEGEGPPIVLIHGAGQNLHAWDEVASLLRPHRRVVRYDLRGCGQSAPLTQSTFAIHAGDLCALIDARGLTRPVVVGFSLGGYIALRASATVATFAGLVMIE